ncbi:MAG: hypothetical protein IPL52_13285 [Flavobacteriales bacterium]|nr:hypothetical protein [Flavobacteriales bacterium]
MNIVVLLSIVFNALWVLLPPAFPTLDGWAHLQTARILMDGPDGTFFCHNPGVVPNRLGYCVLGLLQMALPGLLAERVMLALIVMMTGLSVWMLVRAHGGAIWWVTLVLPFTYNVLLVMGFHNFLLGAALALAFAALWARQKRMTWTKTLLFVAGSLLLFYTHTLAVVVFFLLTGMHEVWVATGLSLREEMRSSGSPWRSLLWYVVACLPAVVALLAFNTKQENAWGVVDPGAAFKSMREMGHMVLFGKYEEDPFISAIKWILLACLALVLWRRLRIGAFMLRPSDQLLAVAAVLLALAIALPDSIGYGSFLHFRLQLLGAICFIAWLAVQQAPVWLRLPPIVALLIVHGLRQHYIGERAGALAEVQTKVLEAADSIPEGSVVLPIVTEGNWLLGHVGSLLAAQRRITVLENYECDQNYFPLVWCNELPEPLYRHLMGHNTCLDWLEPHVAARASPAINRIVLLGYSVDTADCGHANAQRTLDRHFRKTFDNTYARVYEGLP